MESEVKKVLSIASDCLESYLDVFFVSSSSFKEKKRIFRIIDSLTDKEFTSVILEGLKGYGLSATDSLSDAESEIVSRWESSKEVKTVGSKSPFVYRKTFTDDHGGNYVFKKEFDLLLNISYSEHSGDDYVCSFDIAAY